MITIVRYYTLFYFGKIVLEIFDFSKLVMALSDGILHTEKTSSMYKNRNTYRIRHIVGKKKKKKELIPRPELHAQIRNLPESITLALSLPVLNAAHVLAIKLDEKCRESQLQHLHGKVFGYAGPAAHHEGLNALFAVVAGLCPALRDEFVRGVEVLGVVMQGVQGGTNLSLYMLVER